MRELGLRGLKLHPTAQGFRPDDRAVYPIFETAAALGIPVTVHTGTTGLGAGMPGRRWARSSSCRGPIHLDAVAADFPNLQIVMAHPAWPWQDEQLAVALHKPNTWIDLSGWSPRRFAPDLVRNIKGQLQDRVLFGTDYPFLSHEQWFGAWETLDVPDAVTEKVLLRNARRLLGCSSRRERSLPALGGQRLAHALALRLERDVGERRVRGGRAPDRRAGRRGRPTTCSRRSPRPTGR